MIIMKITTSYESKPKQKTKYIWNTEKKMSNNNNDKNNKTIQNVNS